MLFVYWLEDREPFSQAVGSIYQKMQDRGDMVVTSAFTLGELLVAPARTKDNELTRKIETFFEKSGIQIVSLDVPVAKKFAEIRGALGVKAADAIHLACAAVHGVDLFLTNDHELRKFMVPGIQFIDGLETTALGPLR